MRISLSAPAVIRRKGASRMRRPFFVLKLMDKGMFSVLRLCDAEKSYPLPCMPRFLYRVL